MFAGGKQDSIYQKLRSQLLSGFLLENEKLLVEKALALKLGIARDTLRAALGELGNEKLITRIKNCGTFATLRPPDKTCRRIMVFHESSGSKALPGHYLVPGIAGQARTFGFKVEYCDIAYLYTLDANAIRALIAKLEIDRVIFVGANFLGHEKVIGALTLPALPVLLPFASEHDHEVTGWATFCFREKLEWRRSLEFLRARGHRNVAVVTLDTPSRNIRGHTPEEYFALLEELGLNPSPELVNYIGFSGFTEKPPQEIDAVIHKIRGAGATALLCHSGFIAAQASQAIKAFGLRVPDDVSLMGFCSGLNPFLLEPALSSIDIDFEMLGRRAVNVLAHAEHWFQPGSRRQNLLLDIESTENVFGSVKTLL